MFGSFFSLTILSLAWENNDIYFANVFGCFFSLLYTIQSIIIEIIKGEEVCREENLHIPKSLKPLKILFGFCSVSFLIFGDLIFFKRIEKSILKLVCGVFAMIMQKMFISEYTMGIFFKFNGSSNQWKHVFLLLLNSICWFSYGILSKIHLFYITYGYGIIMCIIHLMVVVFTKKNIVSKT
jgi:hypothetical protein